MKFTPLVYTLIISMVLPPPSVFAAGESAPNNYVKRLQAIIDEGAARRSDLDQLMMLGPTCGPKSWPTVCGGNTPGGEMKEISKAFSSIATEIQKVFPDATRVSAPVSADKLAGTTACKGATGGLAKDQEERKAAAEKIVPVLKGAIAKVEAMRKKYNTKTAGFIPMIRSCGNPIAMAMAGDEQLPQFPGEGFLMLFKPVSGTSTTCDPPAADAAKFFVDTSMRKSADGGVARIYGMAGKAPSGLQAYESLVRTTLSNLETEIKDLGTAVVANKGRDTGDCSSLQSPAAPTGKPSETPKGSDISGTDKPGGSKTAETKKAEEEAAAKAAEAKGKLDGEKKDLPVVKNNTGSQTGAGAAKALLTDEKGNALVATGEETPAHVRTSEEDVKAEVAAGQKNYAEDQKARQQYIDDANADPDHKKYVPPVEKTETARDFDHDIDSTGGSSTEGKAAGTKDKPRVIDGKGSYTAEAPAAQAPATPPPAVTQTPDPSKDEQITRLTQERDTALEALGGRNRGNVSPEFNGDGSGGGGGNTRQPTGGGDQTPAPVTTQNTKTPEEGGITATGAIVGIAALGAIGGGIYMATRSKKSSSSGGALAPVPAPAPAATETSVATDTSVATATQTSTATATSSASVTSTNTGVRIDLGPLNGTVTATQTSTQTDGGGSYTTVTATQSQTSTATNGINWGNIDTGAGGGGQVNRANVKVNSSGAAYYVPKKAAPAPAPARR